MAQTAAIVFCALIAALGAFQLALALGAPLGRFAWGGQIAGRLPAGLRIGSAVAILIYGAFALIILARADVIVLPPVSAITGAGAWTIMGFLTLGCVMNAISRSPHERYTMTPLALALAASALIVAMS